MVTSSNITSWPGNMTSILCSIVMSAAWPKTSEVALKLVWPVSNNLCTHTLLCSAVVGGLIWTISEKFKLWQLNWVCLLFFNFHKKSDFRGLLAWCSTLWSYSLVILVQMWCQGGFFKHFFWTTLFYWVFRAGLSYAGGKIPQTTQNVINGQWVESGTDRWIDVHNPATNQVGKLFWKVEFVYPQV